MKMKNLLLFLIFAPVLALGQGNTTWQSSVNNSVVYRGGLGAEKRMLIPIYADTTAANAYYVTYPNFTKNGNIIQTVSPYGVWANNGFAWVSTGGVASVPGLQAVTDVDSTTTRRVTAARFVANGTFDTGTPYASYLVDRILRGTPDGHGFRDQTIFRRPGEAYAAYDAAVRFDSAGNYDHVIGYQSRNVFFGTALNDYYGFATFPLITSGNIGEVWGFKTSPAFQSSTIGTNYGFYVSNPSMSGGSLANNYGLYIESQAAGTNDWAIYSAGGLNEFKGRAFINYIASGYESPLHVENLGSAANENKNVAFFRGFRGSTSIDDNTDIGYMQGDATVNNFANFSWYNAAGSKAAYISTRFVNHTGSPNGDFLIATANGGFPTVKLEVKGNGRVNLSSDLTINTVPFVAGKDTVMYHDPFTGLVSKTKITGGGISAVGPIGSTPNANGLTISGSTLNGEPASISFPGMVTTGAQSFAGPKTYVEDISILKAQNGYTRLNITNTTAGTGAGVGVLFGSTSIAQIWKNSSSTATYKISIANDLTFYNASGGFSMMTDGASGTIRFAAGGSSSAHLTIEANGVLSRGSFTPVHADNAAALAAGMQVGQEYRTSAGVKMEVH